MRFRLLILVATCAVVLAAFGACTIVDGLALPDVQPGDGGSDGAVASVVDAGIDACRHPLYPDPPAVPLTTDTIVFYVAVDSMDFGMTDGGSAAVGYNLDEQCTCYLKPPDPGSCVPSAMNQKNCDDLGNGIDNALSELVNGPVLANNFNVTNTTIKALNAGHNGLLMRVSQYNGQLDDSQVTLDFYASDGPVQVFADGGFGDNVNPTFTKSDVWSVDVASIAPGGNANYSSVTTTTAYVAGGILVANNLSPRIRLTESFEIDLNGSTITAKISNEGGEYHLRDAYFVGRWSTSDALRNIGSIPPPGADGGHICDSPQLYLPVQTLVCAAADISTNGPDNKGRPCDGLSVGIHFSAVPATFGPVVNAPDAGGTPCTNPAADFTCP